MPSPILFNGTVIRAALPSDNPCWSHDNKLRPMVFLWNGDKPEAVPLTHGNAQEYDLEPSKRNGLWKACQLLADYRLLLTQKSEFNILGMLSIAELVHVRRVLSAFPTPSNFLL